MEKQDDEERDESQRPWGATVKGETGQITGQGEGDAGVGGGSFAGTPAGPADAAAPEGGADEGDDPSPS